jgi:hypothetical protein
MMLPFRRCTAVAMAESIAAAQRMTREQLADAESDQEFPGNQLAMPNHR